VELYRNSSVLVHPSEYEGFGLQVAEAMACGLPVVCSNAGSLPEVAGDAAIQLDCSDIEGFADNICRILADNALASELARKGIAQSARFSWRNAAMDVIKVYNEAYRLKS
jgi:glycosyltransferase involved in cell wall biosynthesis